jgi:low temperature requirement protein LtrA
VRNLAWNLWVGAVWLAGALVADAARPAVWAAALICDYAGPLAGHWTPALGRTEPRDWELEAAHFAERRMRFIMIALGETIVAAGFTTSRMALTAGRLTALVLGFGVAFLLWWLYFDFHAERMLRHLREATEQRC